MQLTVEKERVTEFTAESCSSGASSLMPIALTYIIKLFVIKLINDTMLKYKITT